MKTSKFLNIEIKLYKFDKDFFKIKLIVSSKSFAFI